jgi:hypothetical protein
MPPVRREHERYRSTALSRGDVASTFEHRWLTTAPAAPADPDALRAVIAELVFFGKLVPTRGFEPRTY